MSEYQCYEFITLESPLTAKQMAELRAISTRADISPTRFWNEYHWGDLKADPVKLMERYFDAFLYFTDGGTRWLMLRLPKARIDRSALKRYFIGRNAARIRNAGAYFLLDLISEDEEIEYEDWNENPLAKLSSLRADLLHGDMRPAYLAWLHTITVEDIDASAEEPPVPAGLGELTAAQRAMIEFLRIDVDLVAAAATGSARVTDDRTPLRRWLAGLSVKDKDAWLRRAVDDPDLALGGELLRAFRAMKGAACSGAPRTVGALRELAEIKRMDRERAKAARVKKAKAAANAAREKRLAKLAGDVDGAWAQLETLVAASDYDVAVRLAVDLRDLAKREASPEFFTERFEALRKRQPRRRGFYDRWKLKSASK